MPFNLGIQISEQLYQLTNEKKYLEGGFQLAERSRNAVLNSALSSKKALNLGGIPDSLIKKENQLKQKISLVNKQLFNSKGKDSIYYHYQEELFALKRAKENLGSELEKKYPTYYQLKYKTTIASVEQLQKQILGEQNSLIAYYVQFPKAYIWSITKDKENFQQIQLDSNYIEDIQMYRKTLTDLKFIEKEPKKANQLFNQLSHKFYTTFVQPALYNQPTNHLIIIPDHLLGHLPFETFLKSPPNSSKNDGYHQKDYLVHHYEIQYSYSGTLLLQNQHQYNALSQKVSTIAVAADYSNRIVSQKNRTEEDLYLRQNLESLPEVINEVKALETITNGTFLYGNDANEGNFKEKVGQHGIIHLAMHGIFNKKNPIASSLAFTEDGAASEDNFLHASEIGHLPLKAQLVVLSACETGYGKFERGEGIMSLARSFMHAGVPSLIVSLWQVNDYSTSSIMQSFYHELKAGKSKSAALQAAKLTYLKSNHGIAAHPALWAAFIQLGHQGSLDLASNSWFSWISICLLAGFLLFCGFVLHTRKRNVQ